MAKNNITRKSIRPLVVNLYGLGGDAKTQFSNAISAKNLGGTVGAVASGVTGIAEGFAKNATIADTSEIEGNIKTAQSFKSEASNNDAIMNEWNAYAPQANIDWKDIRGVNAGGMIMNTVGAMGSGASSGAQMGGGMGAAIGAGIGLLSSVGGIFAGNAKAKRLADELNWNIDRANIKNKVSLNMKTDNIDRQNDLNILANFSAYGGPINTRDSFSASLFGEGGNLNTDIPNSNQHGGNFSNGVTIIRNGGSHESNPNAGVPIGVDKEGIPNLVEQGEVKFNNYIYSNRLILTKDLIKEYNLPTKYEGHSFASVAEKLNLESSERPTDPISNKGLIVSMTRLQQAQEVLKGIEEQDMKKKRNIFDYGGTLGQGFINGTKRMYRLGTNPDTLKAISNPILTEDQLSNLNSINNPVPVTGIENTKDKVINNSGFNPTELLRYAPVIGSGLNAISDAFGWSNKPDHMGANMIGSEINRIQNVNYTPIGNYLTYKPLDREYHTNKYIANNAATRRALINQSGGNRATANAGILAADYNFNQGLGQLAREAEESNMNQRFQVEQFNRGTNQANSEMGLRASAINQQASEMRLRGRMAQANLMEQSEAQAAAARSANLSNFIEGIGDIGREEFSKDMILKDPSLRYNWMGIYKGAPQAIKDKIDKGKDLTSKELKTLLGAKYFTLGNTTVKKNLKKR